MVFSFGPAMLIDRGMTAVAAGSAVSVVLWLSILSVPAGGAIADRLKRPRLLITVGAGISAALILAASISDQPYLLFALLGLIVGLPAGPIMALPSQVLRVEERATGMGVFYAIYYVTMVAGPIVAATLARGAGAASLAFQAGAGFMICGALSLLAFTVMQARRRIPA